MVDERFKEIQSAAFISVIKYFQFKKKKNLVLNLISFINPLIYSHRVEFCFTDPLELEKL